MIAGLHFLVVLAAALPSGAPAAESIGASATRQTPPRPSGGTKPRPIPDDTAAKPPATVPTDPATERARRAIATLSAAERKEVADFLTSEIEHLRTFQVGLARWVLENQDRDPLAWPAEDARPFFDPEKHAPAQPIARRRLDADDARVVAARRELGVVPDGRGWAYDWASGSVVRRVASDTPERALELALRGLPPRADLVRALVERALDDGSQRAAHAAFAHAYTDRGGNVYPGITLYEAWASGAEIEMPDVDCLGLVHVLDDDWTTWTSIVPAEKQDSLYERIAGAFQPAQRQRELRTALAATFLESSPSLCCGYEGTIDNFHALWEKHASTPETLAGILPDAAGWKAFLAAWVEECKKDGALFQKGIARRATLAREGAEIRATLDYVLEEYGAFARLREAPKPK